jgi:hypothetical protein
MPTISPFSTRRSRRIGRETGQLEATWFLKMKGKSLAMIKAEK